MIKQIALTFLAISLIFGTYHIISQNYAASPFSPQNNSDETPEEETLETFNSRNFFKKWGKKAHTSGSKLTDSQEDYYPEIISYGINFSMEIEQSENSNELLQAIQNVKISAECDVQTIYDEEKNVFDIAVAYTKIVRDNVYDEDAENINEEIYDEDENIDTYYEDDNIFYIKGTVPEEIYGEEEEENVTIILVQDQFFLLQVDADSGEVLSLQIETEYEEDQVITYITEQLINDIFPDLRKVSYQQGNAEESSLGNLLAEYTQEEIDENLIVITKEYNEQDIIDQNSDFPVPDSDYDRIVLLEKDTGLVVEGMTEYIFTMGDDNEFKLTQQEDNEILEGLDMNIDILGKVQGEMISNFWIIEKEDANQETAKRIYDYRQKTTFESIKLSKSMKQEVVLGNDEDYDFELVDMFNENEIIYEDPLHLFGQEQSFSNISDDESEYQNEEESKLKGALTFSENKQLAQADIYGFKIGVEFAYSADVISADVSLKVKVGNTYLPDIFQKGFNLCSSQEYVDKRTKKIQFFQTTIPVYGAISVTVKAAGQFEWGYKAFVGAGSSSAKKNCEFNFVPFFKAGLYGEGSIGVPGVISGGVYAQGNLLDSNLVLKAGSTVGKTYVNATGNFKAFSFDMGIKYEILCVGGLFQQEPLKSISAPKREISVVKNNLRKKIQSKVDLSQIMDIVKKTGRKSWPISTLIKKQINNEEIIIQNEENSTQNRIIEQKTVQKSTKLKGWGWIKKIGKAISKTAKKAVKVVKKTVDIAKKIVEKVCPKSEKYIQLAKYSTGQKSYPLYSKTLNVGF